MEKNTPFLSIIIPIYNVDRYLGECLDSCLRQDLDKSLYELVCVDDGSTDDSKKILDAYAEKNDNIVAVHQKNGGVSAARNTGLSCAKGEYVWFVDADDFIVPDCLNGIVGLLEREDPDRLTLMAVSFPDGEDTARYHQPDVPADKTSAWYIDWMCMCIFRRSLILAHQIRFHEGISLAEDNLFCTMLRPHINKTTHCDKVIYIYRKRENSASTTDTDAKLNKLIRTAEVFSQYGKEGRIDEHDAAVEVRCFMTPVMAAVAKLPHREAKEKIRELQKKGLFPLKPQGAFPVSDESENLSFDNRVLTKLKYRSYTRSGYLELRLFRLFLKIKRKRFG